MSIWQGDWSEPPLCDCALLADILHVLLDLEVVGVGPDAVLVRDLWVELVLPETRERLETGTFLLDVVMNGL